MVEVMLLFFLLFWSCSLVVELVPRECASHLARQMLGLLCPECEKPIFGKCVNARGVRYHPDHFKCEFCKKSLAGMAFYVHGDRPYDKKCALKLFG